MSGIDWTKLYPHKTHRWSLGLRRGNLREYFARRDSTDAALLERARWLKDEPEKYSALSPEALPALADTVALARSLGHSIDEVSPLEQLFALGRAWEADFVWMHVGADGLHRMTGGVVCFPSGWALRDKLGRTTAEIHAPVPAFNAALGDPIEVFLSRLEPGEVWLRENAGFARDASLNHHPARAIPRIDATIQPREVSLRLEHQLLLKLPTSGSILFAIRVEVAPLEQVLAESTGNERLARTLETLAEDAAEYKGLARGRGALVAMCRNTGERSTPTPPTTPGQDRTP